MFDTTQEALEFAAELALEGKLPTSEQREGMLDMGIDFNDVHKILKEAFYDGKELEDAESE